MIHMEFVLKQHVECMPFQGAYNSVLSGFLITIKFKICTVMLANVCFVLTPGRQLLMNNPAQLVSDGHF